MIKNSTHKLFLQGKSAFLDKSEVIISTHESGGDAFVTCLDGVGRITIDGMDYELHEEQSIVMPASIPMQFMAKNSLRCCWWWCFKRKIPSG